MDQKILITGSAGHLGEALVRTLRHHNKAVVGLDVLDSEYTDCVGSITDRKFVKQRMQGVKSVIHTATLHKPHVATHDRQQFIDTNITGTLNLLEEASLNGVESFVFTSTTSAFGDALKPSKPTDPAVWITEDVNCIPKNIYGVTKIASENLCQLFHRNHQLPCLVLRTSRFFPEEDDNNALRDNYAGDNVRVNEFLYRRVDLEDAVNAHLLAAEKAPDIGFANYIISATTPFSRSDLMDLRVNPQAVVSRLVPDFEPEYERRGWRMFPAIERVYVNARARRELDWTPQYNFDDVIQRLSQNQQPLSDLAYAVGIKGYHPEKFTDGPYPVDPTIKA
jgi:UDP-glucose 4-epimerase